MCWEFFLSNDKLIDGQTVTLLTQGCRLNHAETASMSAHFSSLGYQSVDLEQQPNVVVVNTCTVTENGDKEQGKA